MAVPKILTIRTPEGTTDIEFPETDGLYEDMTVGNADQLNSTQYTQDIAPYNFRATPENIGNRERLEKIVGASVVWNQLVQNGNFASIDDWSCTGCTLSAENNVLSATLTSTINLGQFVNSPFWSSIAGHKYIFVFDIKVPKAVSGGRVYHDGHKATHFSVSTSNTWQTIGGIVTNTTAYNDCHFQIFLGNASTAGYEVGDVFYLRNVNIIDLTTFFGSSTIPDYVYSLEQATAGSGVAWLKAHFPKVFDTYHAYNAGEMASVNGLVSHDCVGFNQWDEEWVNGYFGNDGSWTAYASNVSTKNAIPVLPNTTYYMMLSSGDAFPVYLRSNKAYNQITSSDFISRSTDTIANRTFTTPSDCYFMHFNCTGTYGTTYNHDICINLSDPSRNGEYEPYKKRSYALDSTVTLRGIPKLVNGTLQFDGDIYPPSGEGSRRYGIVDLGTLTFSKNDSSLIGVPCFFAIVTGKKLGTANLICKGFVAKAQRTDIDGTLQIANGNSSDANYIVIRDDAYASQDAATFNTAMSGVYLVYELATPTTFEAEPYQLTQIVDDWGTEEFVVDTDDDVVIPVGHTTEYPWDLRRQVENIYGVPKAPTTNGTYKLRCVVSGGKPTFSWTSDS